MDAGMEQRMKRDGTPEMKEMKGEVRTEGTSLKSEAGEENPSLQTGTGGGSHLMLFQCFAALN